MGGKQETRFLCPRRSPRNRVSFRDITIISGMQTRNPVSKSS
ncbi:hypothetical protein [Planktothricoides sp. SR001]|nr:hypothetical protein [Planktothricoides sp. SR001]